MRPPTVSARFLALSTGVGAACTLVAAPIVLAVFLSNLITSLADKVISGFIGLAVVESLPRAPQGHPDPAP